MRLEDVILPNGERTVTRREMSVSMVRRCQQLVADGDVRPFNETEIREWNSLRYIAGVLAIPYNTHEMEAGVRGLWDRYLRDEGVLFPAGTPTRTVLDYRPAIDPTRFTPDIHITNVWEDMTTTPVPPVPPPPPRPRIRVKVWRETSSYGAGHIWKLNVTKNGGGMTLPSTQILAGFLPDKVAGKLPKRIRRGFNCLSDIQALLHEGISPQVIHDGLKAWAFSVVNQGTVAESESQAGMDETAALLNLAPATLEVGGKVFRLVPTGETDIRPLIGRIRKKVLASSQAEAVVIKDRAQTDARILIQQAEEKAARLRQQLEEERARAGARPPDWVIQNSIPHFYRDGRWHLRMDVDCRVTEIRLTVTTWNRIFFWAPVAGTTPTMRMPVWLKWVAPGGFNMDSVYMEGYKCTHISGERTCMGLQGLPPRIETLEHFDRLRDTLSRGMKIVNLNSPLVWDTSRYWPEFKAQLPPLVIKFLARNGFPMTNEWYPTGTLAAWKASHPEITWDREESIEAEQAGTFDTETLANALRPPTTGETNA